METFIISYMIANKIVGVVMAVGFVKYLRKSGFFIQRKIEKWRSKKPDSDVEFWTAFNLLEEALKKPKAKVKKNCVSLVGLLLTMLGKSFKITLLAISSLKPLFMSSKIFIVPLIKK